jgi:hypothetical protein
MWPDEHGFSRHYYTALDTIHPLNGCNGISNSSNPINGFLSNVAPINAIGQYDGTPSNPFTPHTITPTFTMSCPESMYMVTDYTIMIRDVQPLPSLFTSTDLNGKFGAYHCRGSRNLVGNTAQVWESETNCARLKRMTLIQSQSGVPWTDQNRINLNHYIGAKTLLRLFTFYSHKGLETTCVYAAKDNEFNLSVILQAFFTSLDSTSGQYSNNAWSRVFSSDYPRFLLVTTP